MATPLDDNEVPLSFGKGINNTAKETALGEGVARAMVNLDLVSGIPQVREGRSLILPATGCHSMWSNELVDYGLFVQDDTLNRLHSTNLVEALRDGLQLREMSYAAVAGQVYFSNGMDTGLIDRAGLPQPWGVECPEAIFTATGVDGGGLAAGTYRVALSFMAGTEEGGAVPLEVVIGDGQGIALASLPAPMASNVTALRVYLSPANDPRLFHVRDVAIGMTNVTLNASGHGRECDTLYLQPAPPGRHLLLKNGRIFSASGRLLRWTQPQRYGLYNPTTDYQVMRDRITAIGAPLDKQLSLFVGTVSKTYLLQGSDVGDMGVAQLIHTPIVPGSLIHMDPDDHNVEGVPYRCPVWLGGNGHFYIGTPSGAQVLNGTAGATVYQKAAAAFFQDEGGWRYIVAGKGGRKASIAVTDKVVARVVAAD